jgi:hypothetical protein
VYFVRDNWYRDVYAPRYMQEHGGRGYGDYDRRGGEGRDHGRREGRGRGHD